MVVEDCDVAIRFSVSCNVNFLGTYLPLQPLSLVQQLPRGVADRQLGLWSRDQGKLVIVVLMLRHPVGDDRLSAILNPGTSPQLQRRVVARGQKAPVLPRPAAKR
jgi:hypothetical protein